MERIDECVQSLVTQWLLANLSAIMTNVRIPIKATAREEIK
jgi:hypothetical protein